MTIRQTANCALGVARLAFDAGAALLSVAVAVPVAFVAGEARTMAHTARGDITPDPEHSDREHVHDLGTVVELS
ncbi:hypothetical protein CJ179_26360 [Rhodococcus sp. ACS1]|uniref:Uncharacterized protein n=1 Tax=Rhodococcus koreensis TaxID=99653 RepID=A0A1H4SF01_9NOCA|nr:MULTISPECIES: hypothetical protein [Rhodococcus]MDF3306512.1 hypothetical protein [Rhodococcus sp. T2V]PBC46592.1 hypothetical protein CJ179_26360 [Rhodococcus sp. ACS1]QSE82566.1 hypothetical protein JWS14_27100 [Rhodococcus koreensis]QYB02330.1 hypothetical protein I1A62_34750 [Rhodococcus sp. USK10]SEC42658.1 hypothetical protein SAMN04490239_4051 [Rhodococcus koreensis]